MAVPNSRATLISYCKRKLGDGVIDINISSEQEGDVIDDALQYYQDYRLRQNILHHQKRQEVYWKVFFVPAVHWQYQDRGFVLEQNQCR